MPITGMVAMRIHDAGLLCDWRPAGENAQSEQELSQLPCAASCSSVTASNPDYSTPAHLNLFRIAHKRFLKDS
jgi:hypothetical protein